MFKKKLSDGKLNIKILILIIGCLISSNLKGEPMRALLVGNLSTILSSVEEVNTFLKYIKKNKFSELTFYTGGPAATRVIPNFEKEFACLLFRVYDYNVKHVNIAIGSITEFDRVNSFLSRYPVQVDGFHLEYEWWNNKPRDFEGAEYVLQYMKLHGKGRRIGAYIGWVTQEEMDDLVLLVDRLFIHSYVPDGKKTYSRLKSRLDLLPKTGIKKKIDVYAIFSAEWIPKEICNEGPSNPDFYDNSCFMGPWLKANGGFSEAERIFNENMTYDIYAPWKSYANIKGFFYYSYSHVKDLL
jgi:hypothetical protein